MGFMSGSMEKKQKNTVVPKYSLNIIRHSKSFK